MLFCRKFLFCDIAQDQHEKQLERKTFHRNKLAQLKTVKTESDKFKNVAFAKNEKFKKDLKNLKMINLTLDAENSNLEKEIEFADSKFEKTRSFLESEIDKFQKMPDLEPVIDKLQDEFTKLTEEIEFESKRDVTTDLLKQFDLIQEENKKEEEKFELYVQPLCTDAESGLAAVEQQLADKQEEAEIQIQTKTDNITQLTGQVADLTSENLEQSEIFQGLDSENKILKEQTDQVSVECKNLKSQVLEIRKIETRGKQVMQELYDESRTLNQNIVENKEKLTTWKQDFETSRKVNNLDLLDCEQKILQTEKNLILAKDKNSILETKLAEIDQNFGIYVKSADELNNLTKKVSKNSNHLEFQKLHNSIQTLKNYKTIKHENEACLEEIDRFTADSDLETFKKRMENEVSRIEVVMEKFGNPS